MVCDNEGQNAYAHPPWNVFPTTGLLIEILLILQSLQADQYTSGVTHCPICLASKIAPEQVDRDKASFLLAFFVNLLHDAPRWNAGGTNR